MYNIGIEIVFLHESGFVHVAEEREGSSRGVEANFGWSGMLPPSQVFISNHTDSLGGN